MHLSSDYYIDLLNHIIRLCLFYTIETKLNIIKSVYFNIVSKKILIIVYAKIGIYTINYDRKSEKRIDKCFITRISASTTNK